MQLVIRTRDKRLMIDHKSRKLAEVVTVDNDGTTQTIGYIRTETKPVKNAAMTQMVQMKYGRGPARSMGFGEREVYLAYDHGNVLFGRREYWRIDDAAIALFENK